MYKNPALENDTQSKTLRGILKLVYFLQDPLESITSAEDLFITKPVSDLLWGYEDPVFMAIKNVATGASISVTFGLQVSHAFACTCHRVKIQTFLFGMILECFLLVRGNTMS